MCKTYDAAIVEYIRQNVKGVKYKDLAEEINAKFGTKLNGESLGNWCAKHNLKNGLTGCFPKGHIPMNKGKKWDDYLTKEQQEKARQTCFSSERIVNHQDHTWYHSVGDEMEDKDGYIKVKVYAHAKENGGGTKNSTRAWMLKHRYIWEQHYGKIPKGNVIIFLDGNTRNFDINNLAMITMGENAIINKHKLRYDDADFTQIGIDIAKIKLAESEKRKSKK